MDHTYQISNPLLITPPPTIALVPTLPPITRSETLPKKSSMRHLKKQHLIRRKSVPSSSIPTNDRASIPPVPIISPVLHCDKNILSSSIRGSGAIFVVEGVEFDGVKSQSEMNDSKKVKDVLAEVKVDTKIKRKINYKRHSYQVDGSEISPFAHEYHSTQQYQSPYYRESVPMITMATQTDPNRQSFSTSVGFDEDSNSLFMRSSSSSSASSSNQEIVYHAHRASSFKLYDSELDLHRNVEFDDVNGAESRGCDTKQTLYYSTKNSSNSLCSSSYDSSLPCMPSSITRPKSFRNYSIPSSRLDINF